MIDFTAAPATLPPGERIYAIGDIHGCLDRLVALHEMIAEDIAARPAEHTTLVHLGDYVDRGADSAQVVDWLINQPAGAGRRVRQPDGQSRAHDAGGRRRGGQGGAEPLADERRRGLAAELGTSPAPCRRPNGPAAFRCRHLMFLRDLAISHRIGPYLFVHAGVRPGVPLDQQTRHDMLWIREPFLSSRG